MDRKVEFSILLAAREEQHIMYTNPKQVIDTYRAHQCEEEIRGNDQTEFCLELGHILTETLLQDPVKDPTQGPPTPTTPSDVSPSRLDRSFEDVEDIFASSAMSATRSRKSFEDVDDILGIQETEKITPTCTQLGDLAMVQEWLTQLNDLAIEIHSVLDAFDGSPATSADETNQPLWHMVDDLIEAYRDQACQAQLRILQDSDGRMVERRQNSPLLILKGREALCSEVQNKILPKYGFAGLESGVCALPWFEQEKMSTIDVLLGSDPSATQAELRDLVKVQGC